MSHPLTICCPKAPQASVTSRALTAVHRHGLHAASLHTHVHACKLLSGRKWLHLYTLTHTHTDLNLNGLRCFRFAWKVNGAAPLVAEHKIKDYCSTETHSDGRGFQHGAARVCSCWIRTDNVVSEHNTGQVTPHAASEGVRAELPSDTSKQPKRSPGNGNG